MKGSRGSRQLQSKAIFEQVHFQSFTASGEAFNQHWTNKGLTSWDLGSPVNI